MDFTSIIRDVIIFLITVVFEETWRRYIMPWLKDHHLAEVAEIAVNAAEALYGRYNGDEKLKYALDYLNLKGFKVDSDEVIAAIKASWNKLNLSQIEAGVKETVLKSEQK